ncbi:MAG: VOC family protein [Proteobacteria bacterium]|nr:VOC family protein [Pseudomonadota bacterium]MBS0574080.1 VOC family protein [Pseudomonadota bacterium]
MTGRQQRLAFVSLLVPDYDLALAFYVGKLGFDLIDDLPQGGGKRWVTVRPPSAGQGCALLLARAASEAQAAAIGNQSGGRVFLFLETDDFTRDHAAMKAVGVRFEEAPRHEAYGTVAVWRDPWGNRWDLVQFRSAAAP